MTAKDKLAKKEQTDVVRHQEQTQYYQPAVDIRETSGDVILQFDMPGVEKDNVDLTVDKGILTVTGKADEEESGTAVYRETRVGDYRRQFNLTEDVDADSITAEMEAGVLTVKIHKPEKAKPKRIQITSG
ncbi:MAG: Hsp20/alpha crystallin family protein [Planctomycetota bacterium]|jgi:HSP20 family protein